MDNRGISHLEELLEDLYPFGPEMSVTDIEIRKWQREDFTRGYSCANARITSLEAELAAANQKIKDLQEWHDSHC